MQGNERIELFETDTWNCPLHLLIFIVRIYWEDKNQNFDEIVEVLQLYLQSQKAWMSLLLQFHTVPEVKQANGDDSVGSAKEIFLTAVE